MTRALSGRRVEVSGPITSERIQPWTDAYLGSRIADAVWMPEGRTQFRGWIRRRELQDLVLVDHEADPFGARWTSSSRAADYVGVSVNTRHFTERVVTEDREYVSTTSVGVWDPTVLRETEVLSPMAQTLLLVPKSALHMTRTSSLLLKDVLEEADRALLRFLRSLVLAISADADHFRPAAAQMARNAVVDTLLLLAQERRPSTAAAVSDSMRLAVGRWVDENLHLGQLTPGQAARQYGISVRSLHRLYADSGDSFGALVRRRRLDLARGDLLRTDDMVQTIAMRWGYADASKFINEFKRAHGLSPAAFRKASRTAA